VRRGGTGVRLTARLIAGSFAVVCVLVALVVATIDRRLHVRIADESALELAREARLVAIEWNSATDADSLANAAGAALGHRVTLIDPHGHVIGDSEFDGPALQHLQNHSTRPEVIEAIATGTGTSRRRSPSAGDEEQYAAVRASLGVARVSVTTSVVEQSFDRARRDVLLAGAIALVISMLIAGLFSRSVSRPIVELRDVAQAMAGGDLTRRPRLTGPAEVGELAGALHAMAEQLGARLLALETEESLLTGLFESLNEGVLAVDAAQQVVRINRVGRTLLQVRGGVPFPASELPEHRALATAIRAALDGEATPPAEVVVDDRTLMLTARPLADGGAVVAMLDLTAMRRLETVRRDFVANVSHELKTPLTIIGGFAETLVDDDPPVEQRRAFAETIRVNTVRMQRIVDDLLDLSRIESGGWVPNPTLVDVAGVADDALAGVEAQAAERGVALSIAPAIGGSEVYADPLALRQLIANLVENAVRHTRDGLVTVFTEVDDAGVWVGVRDTGTGIGAEHLPRIFERFYRVDTGRSREAGGTGLGLAIVRHLVEAHGGRVRATSVPGRGTTIAGLFPNEGQLAAH